MFDSKFWQEIKTNSQKAYKVFVSYIKNDNKHDFSWLQPIHNLACIDICYCTIERFFWDNKIIFPNIISDLILDSYTENLNSENIEDENYEEFLKFKVRAVYEAFEILEKQLEEK